MINGIIVRRLAVGAALASMTLGLAGCSGGGGSSSSANTTPTLVTLPEYQALRANTVSTAASTVPDAATMEALVAANNSMAVEQLRISLALEAYGYSAGNTVAAPPLTYAALRTLGAAASGDSLAEISSHFDLAPSPYEAAEQTGRVTSLWWADRGRHFRTEFLSATDALGPEPRLAGWSAAETGFADGSAASDAALAQSFAATGAGLSLGEFSTPTNIRLLANHTLTSNAAWDTVTPFEGVFNRVRLPLLRLTSGVTRYIGTDYTADLVRSGDLHVMTLRPASAGLANFAASRLALALDEAVRGLLVNPAVPATGEMLLPQADISLVFPSDASMGLFGVSQVYSETLANLKNLDGLGGTYAQTQSAAKLHIAANGLELQAAHAMAFTFSPRNVNGPTYGSSDSSYGVTSTLGNIAQTCVWPTPDLTSFFLVILDTRRQVVSLAAIQSLPGTAVTPVCTSSLTSSAVLAPKFQLWTPVDPK